MKNRLLGNLKRGLVFIISAPAGTGKTTLVQKLTQEFPCVVASVSYTTRPMRSGEIDQVHYHFVTEEEFKRRIAEGDFLESVQLYGYYYGSSRRWIEEKLAEGKHVLLVIDTQGAQLLRESIQATSIFIAPPSIEELKRRLLQRRTESSELIEKRLLWAKEEMKRQSHYDYLLINDDLTIAYQTLRSILIAEEHRVR